MSAIPNTDADDRLDQATQQGDEEAKRLNLDVQIEQRGACQRHITVTVPRDDIERYCDNAFKEMMPTSTVPGFRPGRAPRELVEHRFRKEVADQVKGSLLLDSMSQVNEEHKLAAISEPDIDPMAVELPSDGPLTFEFDLEVRPDFELPEWKGLSIDKPSHKFTKKEIDTEFERLLAERGRLVPQKGAAKTGDYVVVNIAFKLGDEVLSQAEEEVIRIRPVLSFRDGKIEKFDKLMKGVKAGETREVEVTLSDSTPNAELRGKKVNGTFEVLEVKRLELPDLTPELLQELGDFESEEDLRDALKTSLERRLSYQQNQQARKQVLAQLTVAADWELPPDLLERQSQRELERAVLELRASGFNENEIRARVNELSQNSRAATAQALKEHFILERIVEEEGIEAEPDDYDREIELIAMQRDESPRRVRAQIEKADLMDALRNQIIERKAIDLILSHARFKEVPFKLEAIDAEALDSAVGGQEPESDIPEAKYADEAAALREPEDHT